MNKIVQYIFIVLLSLWGAAFFITGSVDFKSQEVVSAKKADDITSYLIELTNRGTDKATVVRNLITDTSVVPKGKTPILTNFWRLVSYLYVPPEGNQSNVLTRADKEIYIWADMGIISLYDLFTSYRIHSTKWRFRLDQMTNWSFYIWHEKDGKVAIYAIDGVARLNFIDKWEIMTSMVLFPGAYIHFDPAYNASLKGADLYRIITTLDVDKKEVFEFVNPRVNIGDDQDTFFNYRLPPESKILFQVLSSIFRDWVENVNALKKYSDSQLYASDEPNSLLFNPSKINYRMLRELSGLLSDALKPTSDAVTLPKKIQTIYETSKSLSLDHSTTTADATIEQFLLDGRFVLYSGWANSHYQDIYEAIASMIGIHVSDGKMKLLQNLSDIYSRNLFTQKNSKNLIKIDTYVPTANELTKTIDQNEAIEQKDYFDIAIYAFNILRKTEIDGKVFPLEITEDASTYDLLNTFFIAAEKYISSIKDDTLRVRTINSFSTQFYEHLLTVITHSLYKNYAVIDKDAIYPDPKFVDGVTLKVSSDLRVNVHNLNAVLDRIAPTISDVFLESDTGDISSRIKKETLRIKAFEEMMNPEKYKEYIRSPYKVYAPEANDLPLLPLPSVNETLDAVEHVIAATWSNDKTNIKLETDPRVTSARKIFRSADNTSFVFDGWALRIVNVPYTIDRKSTTKISDIKVTATMEDEQTLKDITLNYKWRNIQVASDSMNINAYYSFIAKIYLYLDAIDSADPDGKAAGEYRIFPSQSRINIGENIYNLNN